MDVESGAVRVVSVVGSSGQARTLLRLKPGEVYRVWGFHLSLLLEQGATAVLQALLMLKAAPVVRALDVAAVNLFGGGPAAALGHPAVLGHVVLGTDGDTNTLSVNGPYVALPKPLVVPGLYVDAIVASPLTGRDLLAMWTIYFERVRMSALSTAALATGWGWDNDATEPGASAFLDAQIGSSQPPIG